jgi:hypothetical protein
MNMMCPRVLSCFTTNSFIPCNLFPIFRRDELFRISQLPGQYPQFFVVDENKEASYIGDLQRLQDIDEDSTLPESIIGAHPLIMTWERLLNAGYRHKLLLITSTLNICKNQVCKQDRAMAVLNAKRIPFDVVNAADQNMKERYDQ